MRRFKAHRYRALLLVLLLGFTAATLHVSMHLLSDQQNCEFCSGHANPMHAMAPASVPPILAPTEELAVEFVARLHSSQSYTSYRQRAPPRLELDR